MARERLASQQLSSCSGTETALLMKLQPSQAEVLTKGRDLHVLKSTFLRQRIPANDSNAVINNRHLNSK